MFYGEYSHTLDRKGRLIIPSRFRELFAEVGVERIFATRGLDGCIFIFAEEEWRLQESKFKAMSFTKSEARKFNRLYFSGACELIIDKQGRILLPRNLKEYAHIKNNVLIVGVSNRIEIWSGEHWQEFYKTSRDSFEEIAEKLIENV